MIREEGPIEALRAAVELACQPTYVPRIVEGRRQTAELPRAFVLDNILRVGRDSLNFSDYWEYGRFLELLNEIGASDELARMIAEGRGSADADVRDMAELWALKVSK